MRKVVFTLFSAIMLMSLACAKLPQWRKFNEV